MRAGSTTILCRTACRLGVTGLMLGLVQAAYGQSAPSVVVQWNDAALQAIRDTHPAAPVAARSLAVLHTCIYDAWPAYDPVAVGTQLGAGLRRPPADQSPDKKQAAISYAAYRALVDLFPQPEEVARFQDLMRKLGYDPGDQNASGNLPQGVGALAAQAVLAYRHRDRANQLGDQHPGAYSDFSGYTPVNPPDRIVDPDRWQPLPVPDGKGGLGVQQFIVPYWGEVVPFALTSGDQFRPAKGPPPFGSEEYILQTRLILGYSVNLGDPQKVLVDYWTDGPGTELGPGHWCRFAQLVSQRDQNSLDDDVKLFFALTNAMSDTGIACWDAKRAYDSVRPITAVHFLYQGKKVRSWAGAKRGIQWMKGEAWQPYQTPAMVTPPDPEYVAEQSAFSAAGAEILARFTGSDTFVGSYTAPAGSS